MTLQQLRYVTAVAGTIIRGEELGMTNPHFTKIEQYRDIESRNYYRILREQGKTEAETLDIIAQRSRDDSRTPMQWDASENAGFTTGTPWIGIADNYKAINAAAQRGAPDSIRSFYKTLVALRKKKCRSSVREKSSSCTPTTRIC